MSERNNTSERNHTPERTQGLSHPNSCTSPNYQQSQYHSTPDETHHPSSKQKIFRNSTSAFYPTCWIADF
jgi:hypothetical protein